MGSTTRLTSRRGTPFGSVGRSGSLVCDTATHCVYGVVETENCVMTQRLAALSHWTIGSPSLLFWQPPPKPLQRVLPAAGP